MFCSDAEPTKSYRRRSLHCVRDYMELMNNWRFWLPKTFLASLLHVKTNFAEMEAQSRLRVAQVFALLYIQGKFRFA